METEKQKPLLGPVPHWAANRSRNIELAEAIAEYCKEYYKPGNSKEHDKNILEAVRGWAMEIVFNCDTELNLTEQPFICCRRQQA